MTVWIMHMPMKEQEENALMQLTELPLPFGDLPDLSTVNNGREFKRLISLLQVDTPPETIERLHDKIWTILSELQPEDIIVLPLQHKRVVAVAEISGRYSYAKDEGSKAHRIAVKWHEKTIPFIRFRLHKSLIESKEWSIAELKDQSARAIIQLRLPYKYNRFAKVKWIASVFILWQALQMLLRLKS
ncbi:MAG: hypothetical protein ACK502_07860 [Alphaproteobacteria bacterium]